MFIQPPPTHAPYVPLAVLSLPPAIEAVAPLAVLDVPPLTAADAPLAWLYNPPPMASPPPVPQGLLGTVPGPARPSQPPATLAWLSLAVLCWPPPTLAR